MVAVNGIQMYYEIRGEGKPLVLIAGLATDLTKYDGMIAKLSQSYKVVAFDNRGAGRTDKPDIPYSIEMMADDTSGLLTLLGIERAHIMGVSMGGRIAIALALQHPELVKSLILVSTSASRSSRTWTSRLLMAMPKVSIVRTMGEQYPQPYYAFVRQREASRNYEASDRLNEISVPTLILHGKRDRFTPYGFAEEMHARIRDSKLTGFNGGHLLVFFRRRELLDAVLEFLEAQTVNGAKEWCQWK